MVGKLIIVRLASPKPTASPSCSSSMPALPRTGCYCGAKPLRLRVPPRDTEKRRRTKRHPMMREPSAFGQPCGR
jgi:hypothetical protein